MHKAQHETIVHKMEDIYEQVKSVKENHDNLKTRIDSYETMTGRPKLDTKEHITNTMEYKKAVNEYLRNGTESGLIELQNKGFVQKTKDSGYELIPFLNRTNTNDSSNDAVIRGIASVQDISTESLEVLIDLSSVDASWVLETDPRSVGTSVAPQKKIISVHELNAQPKATQKLIDDSVIDIGSWLSTKLTDIFLRGENAAFINGNGDGKPTGILSMPNGRDINSVERVISGTTGSISTDDIVNLMYSLENTYSANTAFVMHISTLQIIKKLKDTTGRYILDFGVEPRRLYTIFGVPVYISSDMPMFASGASAIIYGNFKKGYQVVDRGGVSILRDPYTEKPFVKFYSSKRVGGNVIDGNALKILEIAS